MLLEKQAQRAEDAHVLGLDNTDHHAVSTEEAKIDVTVLAQQDVKQAVVVENAPAAVESTVVENTRAVPENQ